MGYLSNLIDEHAVKVALLNEATVFHLRQANSKAAGDGSPPFAFSEEGIKGRDFWTEENEVRKPYDRSRWSAAVMSPLGPNKLGEEDVRARRPHRAKIVDIPFTNSRPGSWIAATVAMENEPITCVSLYGLIEELTDASMHRSLSEISPIFSDPNYKELVLLGGDFNVSTALADPSARERSRLVLDRIKAYGLVDCLAKWRKEKGLPRLPGCGCEDEECHTLTRLTPNKSGEKLPWQERTSAQVDYLFASKPLADRLDEVVEIPPEEWEPFSDHGPIIAKFRAS